MGLSNEERYMRTVWSIRRIQDLIPTIRDKEKMREALNFLPSSNVCGQHFFQGVVIVHFGFLGQR